MKPSPQGDISDNDNYTTESNLCFKKLIKLDWSPLLYRAEIDISRVTD